MPRGATFPTSNFSTSDRLSERGCFYRNARGTPTLKRRCIRYVRRELRALTSKDRAAFLESMHVVWALETSAGKKSYGDDYRGLDYFAEKHLRGSAALVCDHWCVRDASKPPRGFS